MASYFQADLPTSTADSHEGTHLIVSGKGLEVDDQWLRAAHTQALLFKDRKIHGPIRLIGAIENSETINRLNKWGYTNIQVFEKTFTGVRLISRFSQVQKIASIDMIGHNGAILGFVLEDYSNRFYLDDASNMASLASKMSDKSFVRIMGCNTGWNLAPKVAANLKVPVAGTFTFADIQKLHETKDWYFNDEGRYPDGIFLRRNEVSYRTPVNCEADGGCMRLKPVHINYQGKHGNYAGTVPFLKYFCGPVSEQDCQKRMARSLMYEVGLNNSADLPSEKQFQEILADHFCPGYKSTEKRVACRQAVIKHLNGTTQLNSNFSTSDGATIKCTMQKCEIKQDCSGDSCVMIGSGRPGEATTFVNELNFYKQGYKSLLAE